jgi:hypothetical protein
MNNKRRGGIKQKMDGKSIEKPTLQGVSQKHTVAFL